METTLQPNKQNRIYGYLAALAGMVLAFVAGVFVGTHPEWIPNMPWAYHESEDQPRARTPDVPTTQAVDMSQASAQTQPSTPQR